MTRVLIYALALMLLNNCSEKFVAAVEKINRVVDSVVKGHRPVPLERFAENLNANIPAGQDPMPWLIELGHVFESGTGQYSMGPLMIRLMTFFDDFFADLRSRCHT